MNREEILKKVEEVEYERKCIATGICPACGGDLESYEIDYRRCYRCRECSTIYYKGEVE